MSYIDYMECPQCHKEFISNRPDKKYCRKQCRKAASQKRNNSTKRWRKKKRWKNRGINITYQEYNDLLNKQEGKCAICKKHYSEVIQSVLQVDHNHSTGKIRSLLCGSCNMGLGFFKENQQILKQAIEYLNTYSFFEKKVALEVT